jgi:Inner membrane protein YgaP-like, transmembrane domain
MAAGFFSRNEHKVERVVRVVVGLAVLSLFFVGPRSPWALIGLVPVLTGLAGTCPLYSILGFSTCPREGAC